MMPTKNDILEKYKKERTDAISDMFDNVSDIGIYPTGIFFGRIDNACDSAMDSWAALQTGERDERIAKLEAGLRKIKKLTSEPIKGELSDYITNIYSTATLLLNRPTGE